MGYLQGTIVRVPAGVGELECKVYNGLVVHEFSTHKPVSRVETSQVRADVPDGSVVLLVGQVEMVAYSRRLHKEELKAEYEKGCKVELLTRARTFMDVSTAVAHVSANMLSLVFERRAYLIRYSK